MPNTVYFGRLENPDITVEAGAFTGNGDFRNDGPAIWFDDGSGGIVVEAPDRAAMIEVLTELLEAAKTLPEPVPDALCRLCGHGIRWLADRYGEDMAWRHRPSPATRSDGGPGGGSDEWVQECWDERTGEWMRTPRTPHFPEGREMTAWPATTNAEPKLGDQVLDMTDLDEPDDEGLAEVAIVTGSNPDGTYELDHGPTREPSVLRTVAPYTNEEHRS